MTALSLTASSLHKVLVSGNIPGKPSGRPMLFKNLFAESVEVVRLAEWFGEDMA